MSLIKGVHHIALKCCGISEFEKVISFYHDVLGMPLVRTWGEGDGSGAMLETGDGSVMEITASGGGEHIQGAIRHFALATDDVDACASAASAAGYPITSQPKDIVIASNPPLPARIAFCIGPLGEEIEFFAGTAGGELLPR